jgi:recombinational DNA repair ATPase RecF
MADQPSPRRRFQFRLRTLMIVVTLLAVACWGIVDRARLIRERDDALRQARDAKKAEAELEANDRQIAEKLVELTASDQNTIKRLQGQIHDLRNKKTN